MPKPLPDSIPKDVIVDSIKDFDNGAPINLAARTFTICSTKAVAIHPRPSLDLPAKVTGGRAYVPDDFTGGLDSKSFRILWDAGFEIIFKTDSQPFAEEVLPGTSTEGAVRQITTNAYERDEKARREAIKLHGCVCKVCDLDFGEAYGSIGTGFIHVHHLVPLASIGKEYVLNPKTDLVPVCPNCHAMLHWKNPPFLIEEMRAMHTK